MRLKFFVTEDLKELKYTLEEAKFEVRSNGKALPGEIAFFKDEKQNGFCFCAYKFFDVPEEVADTPFLVKVGKNWTKEGLKKVISGYFSFDLPSIEKRTGDEIIDLCYTYVKLPWGGVPTGSNKGILIWWLHKADRYFPRSLENGAIEFVEDLIKIRNVISL